MPADDSHQNQTVLIHAGQVRLTSNTSSSIINGSKISAVFLRKDLLSLSTLRAKMTHEMEAPFLIIEWYVELLQIAVLSRFPPGKTRYYFPFPEPVQSRTPSL